MNQVDPILHAWRTFVASRTRTAQMGELAVYEVQEWERPTLPPAFDGETFVYRLHHQSFGRSEWFDHNYVGHLWTAIPVVCDADQVMVNGVIYPLQKGKMYVVVNLTKLYPPNPKFVKAPAPGSPMASYIANRAAQLGLGSAFVGNKQNVAQGFGYDSSAAVQAFTIPDGATSVQVESSNGKVTSVTFKFDELWED